MKPVGKQSGAPNRTSDSLKNLLAPAFASTFNNSYRSQTVPPNQWSSVELLRDHNSVSRQSEWWRHQEHQQRSPIGHVTTQQKLFMEDFPSNLCLMTSQKHPQLVVIIHQKLFSEDFQSKSSQNDVTKTLFVQFNDVIIHCFCLPSHISAFGGFKAKTFSFIFVDPLNFGSKKSSSKNYHSHRRSNFKLNFNKSIFSCELLNQSQFWYYITILLLLLLIYFLNCRRRFSHRLLKLLYQYSLVWNNKQVRKEQIGLELFTQFSKIQGKNRPLINYQTTILGLIKHCLSIPNTVCLNEEQWVIM